MSICSERAMAGCGRGPAEVAAVGERAAAWGLVLGVVADAVFGDPRRGHPVAGFGRVAAAVEGRIYRDDRGAGVVHVAVLAGGAALAGWVAERAVRRTGAGRVLLTGVAVWAVLGGTSLAREGAAMAAALEAGDLEAARARLPHLCGRDPSGLDAGEIARATVESLAENASDAVVAPLLWGAVAGVPGLLAYRAVNTLDAMVGHRSPRYARFGWAAARLDDVANVVPARVTGLLAALAAPVVGGSVREALRVLARDGGRHPSPNAGRCEAAYAGALGVRLGGVNVYAGRAEHRPELGAGGRKAGVADVRRAVRLTRVVAASAAVLAAGLAWRLGRRGR